MRLFEAVARQLAVEGVTDVFGLMGDGNLKLIPRLGSEGIAFWAARHEAGAVAAADGFARSTERVGVATVTQGPGLTNALTALITAHRGRTPLVALCGDTPLGVRGLPQDIDQGPILRACGIAVQSVDPLTGHADVAAAFARARDERRPVAVVMPTDVQEHEVGDLPVEGDRPDTVSGRAHQGLDAAVEALASARRPVVLAGRGAIASGAREQVVALADHVGALLATSLPANAWFSGHPWYLGTAGGFATETARRLIADADVVVALGASVNHFTSRGGTLFESATLVQVDTDPEAFGRYVTTHVGILGDAGGVAGRLVEALPATPGYRDDAVREDIRTAGRPADDEAGGAALDPRTLSRALATLLPADRTLVVDGGHFMGFPSMGIDVQDPRHYVFTLDFGSIGLGVGAAVGAAVASPTGTTVAAVGDGGLMLSLGELDTAVRYRLPIVFAIYNDSAYGAELHFLQMSDLDDTQARFENPDLAVVAEALGMRGYAITKIEDLEPFREHLAAGLDGPVLLDCRVDPGVRAAWLVEAFDRGTH